MSSALFVAWRSGGPSSGCWGPVGRLEHGEGGYRFVYTRGACALPGFEAFPEMASLDAIYESRTLFPLFANRLLARSRPEYEAFLAWSGFSVENPPDPIAILGVTEGLRATDSLELFPCPRPSADGSYVNKFFVHGIRHMSQDAMSRIAALSPGTALELVPEDCNEYDQHAVAIESGGSLDSVKIGYVPRYLACDVRRLSANGTISAVDLTVERVNRDAPLQQRLLCRMTTAWPVGFRPCEGEEFSPIPAGVPAVAA